MVIIATLGGDSTKLLMNLANIMEIDSLERLKVLLIANQLKIAVAESLTCGRLQAALGSISGASNFFEGGITAYNLEQKVRLLNIDQRHAEEVNSVSQRVALELAEGVCNLFRCDIGIGTTGYAESSPDNRVAQPLAYFAICRRDGERIQNIAAGQILGAELKRIQMQELVSNSALEALLAYVEHCQSSDNQC